MAREHLYKAKRKDNGEWVYFTPFSPVENTQTHLIESQSELVFFEHDTICEYTGLPDKKGTKIFEGDFIKLDDEVKKIFNVDDGVVRYAWGGFYVGKFCSLSSLMTLCSFDGILRGEIIGNKFDNPELLKVQDE